MNMAAVLVSTFPHTWWPRGRPPILFSLFFSVTHKTGDLAHKTGDLAHKTGDLAHMTGDLANKTGDLAHMTGDLAHTTGDLAHKTGDLAHIRESPLGPLQGYLAHKNPPPPRTLQQDYIEGRMAVLGGGGCFL